jgi:hypothetical protein
MGDDDEDQVEAPSETTKAAAKRVLGALYIALGDLERCGRRLGSPRTARSRRR